jgi:hypothetical protein
MSINYSATTPAAPAGKTNVVFQSDGKGNISAYYTPSSGSGTVTSVATAGIATGGPITTMGTVTVTGSGSTTTAATADTNVASAPAGDVITADGSGNVKDSGTLLSSLAPKASPALTGVPTAPTAAAATNTTQLATTAFVESEIPLRSAVTSVFARTGAVVATTGDYTQTQISAGAIANSTTATTQAALSNDTKVATDAYVDSAVAVETARATTAEATKQATLTGVGIARNTGACTELSGDVTTSGSNAASVVKVNGAAVPASKTIVGTNSSSQIVDASSATLSNNTTGTAANLSGTPALPNGTTATTQSALDGSTQIATDAYADAEAAQNISTGHGGFFSAGYEPFDATVVASSDIGIGTANLVKAVQFTLKKWVTINKVVAQIVGTATGTFAVGIYNAAGTSLLVQANFSTASAAVISNAPVTGSGLTLAPGVYWFVWSCSSTTPTFPVASDGESIIGILNKDTTYVGTAANAMGTGSGTPLPSSLGTITSSAEAMAMAFFHP